MPRMILGLFVLLLVAGCGSDATPPTPATEVITPTAVVTNVPTVTASPTRVVLTRVTATTTATVPSPATATVTATAAAPPSPAAPPTVAPPLGEAAPAACSWPSGWVTPRVAAGDTVGELAACVGATVADIVAANCLPQGGYLIFAGQTVALPRACVATPTTTPYVTVSPTGTGETQARTTETPTITVINPDPPQPGTERILIAPPSGSPGTRLTLTLTNFITNSTVHIAFRYLFQSGTCATRMVTIGPDNTLVYSQFWIPGFFPNGTLVIEATDAEGRSAEGNFTVVNSIAPSPCEAAPIPTPPPEPTTEPTVAPTEEPTTQPTLEPTVEPAPEPTVAPTEEPTTEPTVEPTASPTKAPTTES